MQNIPQPRVHLRLSQNNARHGSIRNHSGKSVTQLLQLDRRQYLRRRSPPRLLRRLPGNPSPAFMPLYRRSRQMSIRPLRNHRNNPRHSNLRTLLNRPLHAIKLEDGENKSKLNRNPLGRNSRSDLVPKRKFHPLIRHRSNFPEPHRIAVGNIKFLPNPCPQNAAQVQGMLAGQSGNISMNFVGNPAAASQKTVLSSWFSVLSSQFSVLRKILL